MGIIPKPLCFGTGEYSTISGICRRCYCQYECSKFLEFKKNIKKEEYDKTTANAKTEWTARN